MPLDAVGGRVGRREPVVVVATSGFLISIAAVSFVLHLWHGCHQLRPSVQLLSELTG